MLGAVAVVAAVLLWQWRPHRGPAMVAALAIGVARPPGAAAGVGARPGAVALRGDRHRGGAGVAGAPRALRRRGARGVLRASPLQIAATLLFPAAVAALVYALLAVSTQRDDLGALAAGRGAGDRAACHSGERSTVRPVITFAAIFASRAMPT